MNLFVVGWGLGPDETRRTLAELRRTAGLYPQLDAESLWWQELPGGVLAGSVRTQARRAAPREYLHVTDAEVVLFDGLPIDPAGRLQGHRASELAAAWDRLPDTLEGRFAIVRVEQRPVSIEILNDPLGVQQVYFYERAGSSLVSNSAGLIQRAVAATRPDPLGVSLFLTLDWVGGDRTLRDDVRVAAGGQHWSWHQGNAAWTRRTYWSMPAHAGRPIRAVDADLVDEVVTGLANHCGAAAAINGSVYAPITGGKDSRMLAAVLMTHGIPASYWTKGDDGSLDLRIGREIAVRYSLPHRVSNRPTQVAEGRDPTRDIAGEWESLSSEFVAQNDGLASLFLVGNIQGQPSRVDRLAVTLTAMGAESAKSSYHQGYLCGPGASFERTRTFLPYVLPGQPRGLIKRDAYGLARTHVRNTVERLHDEGAAVDNLGVAFYLDERCRRWNANNPRELAQTEDKVPPFLARPYVEPVLGLAGAERAADRLHRAVIRSLVPELENDPPFDRPWREGATPPSRIRAARNWLMPQVPLAWQELLMALRDRVRPPVVSRVPYSPYDEESWLEANLGWARDVTLGQPDSPLWGFVDRQTCERLLSATGPQGMRRVFQLPIFAALTMFAFERLERTLATQDLPFVTTPADPLADTPQ